MITNIVGLDILKGYFSSYKNSLSKLRFVFYFSLFLIYLQVDHSGFASLPKEFFQPTGLYRSFHFMASPFNYMYECKVLLLISFLTTALGIFPNFFKLTSLIFMIIAGAYADSFAFTHTSIITVPVLFCLCFFDFSKKFEEKNLNTLFCLRFVVCGHYFFSGLQKLHLSGTDWIANNKLIANMIYYKKSGLSDFLLTTPFLLASLLALVVMMEITFPACLFFKRMRIPYFLFFFTMHIVTSRIIEIHLFVEWMLALVVFLPWEDLLFVSKPASSAGAKINPSLHF